MGKLWYVWTGAQLAKGSLQAIGSLFVYAIAAYALISLFRHSGAAPKEAAPATIVTDAVRWKSPVLGNAIGQVEDVDDATTPPKKVV